MGKEKTSSEFSQLGTERASYISFIPKVSSQYWFDKTGTRKTYVVLVVSPLELIRKQQVERLNTRGMKSIFDA